jgi:short-subunit dehydrogenase
MAKSLIWITGAGTGIGRALALELSARGGTIAASARTAADLGSLSAEATGGAIHPYPLDVTDSDAVARVAEAIEHDLGPPDLFVLNAGTHAEVTAADFDLAAVRRVIDTNVMGTANCLAAILPGIVARRRGHVALVASVAGYRGLPSAGAYSASKAALIALGEALKPELEKAGADLSIVNPGFVDTPLTRRNTFPMPFMIEPEAAARHIADGLAKRRAEIVFPWQMAVLMKLLRLLPYGLFYAVTRRLVRD